MAPGYRGWISSAAWAGVDIEDYPYLKAWEDRMWARPAVKKGADVPDKYTMKERMKDKETMDKHAAEVSTFLVSTGIMTSRLIVVM